MEGETGAMCPGPEGGCHGLILIGYRLQDKTDGPGFEYLAALVPPCAEDSQFKGCQRDDVGTKYLIRPSPGGTTLKVEKILGRACDVREIPPEEVPLKGFVEYLCSIEDDYCAVVMKKTSPIQCLEKCVPVPEEVAAAIFGLFG